MSRSTTFFAQILTLSFLVAASYGEPIEKPPVQEVSGTINWQYDYAAAQKLGKEANKPLFVVFRCER